jgi:uncharacterized protein YwqG
MNFFKRLLGKEGKNKETPASSGPSTALETLLKPLIKPATQLHLQGATAPVNEAPFTSHFGGQPYFEKGEAWPLTKDGRPLQFIVQVFNEPGIELPASIQLIQFYYDFEEGPWQTSDEGWLVKIYEQLDRDKQQTIEKPAAVEDLLYCAIRYEKVQSLPSWEGIEVYSKEVTDLSCSLNDDAPWEAYDTAVEKLIGKQDYRSQLGGYPDWVQGERTPLNSEGKPMQLLFQIDSEEEAGLMWGDVGLIYVFYDSATKQVEFTLQCH